MTIKRPKAFSLTSGTLPIAESLAALPVNAETSQLMPVCGHPQSAVAHPGDERIRTRYCTMCAAEARKTNDSE